MLAGSMRLLAVLDAEVLALAPTPLASAVLPDDVPAVDPGFGVDGPLFPAGALPPATIPTAEGAATGTGEAGDRIAGWQAVASVTTTSAAVVRASRRGGNVRDVDGNVLPVVSRVVSFAEREVGAVTILARMETGGGPADICAYSNAITPGALLRQP